MSMSKWKLWMRFSALRLGLSILAIGLAAVAAMIPRASAASTAQSTVRVGYVKVLGLAPAFIAKDEKFFGQNGIHAEFFGFATGPDLYKALAANQLDIGFAGIPQAVAWAARGMRIQVVAQVSSGHFGLVTYPGAKEKTVAEFRGKTIAAVAPGSGDDVLLRAFLLPSAKLTPADVHIEVLQQSNMIAALHAHMVDAAFMGDPFLTSALLRGFRLVGETPDPGFIVLGPDSFIDSHRQVVRRFLLADEEAVRFIRRQPAKAAADLAANFNVAPIHAGGKTYSPAAIIARALHDMKFATAITKNDVAFYQRLANAVASLGYIPGHFNVSSIIDTSFAK
jgi:NitT/TauT family transport system substrate-binding protein